MNVHIIIGEDEYLVAEAAKKLIGDGVGLEVIDSRESTNAELQLKDLARARESFETPPFFDPKKTTWWKNVAFLPGGKSSEEVTERLVAFAKELAAAELPENQRFILTGPKLLKTSVFHKTLSGRADVKVFGSGKPWEKAKEAMMTADRFAAERGIAFAPGAAEEFVGIVGMDSRSIMSEVGKLADYLGPGVKTATAEDVKSISSPGIVDEPVPWAITDAIGNRDTAKALEAVRKFELENGFAVFISGVIEKFFRTLYELKAAEAKGTLREAMSGMTPFAAKKNSAFLGKWTLRELRVARARFLDHREKVVSGASAGDVLVITELLRALARPKRTLI